MGELATLLREIEATWKRKGFDPASRFAPGLGPEEIVSSLASVGLPAPAEVMDWFTWHDGAIGAPSPRRTTIAALAPLGYEPISLGAALGPEIGRGYRLELAERLARESTERGETDETSSAEFWWRPEWLPIAVGHRVMAVELSSGSDTVNVLAIDWEDGEFATPITESLAELVRVLLAIPDGCWRFSSEEKSWIVDSQAASDSIPARVAALL